MKIILATITAFLLFSCAFGQTTATTADGKINDYDRFLKQCKDSFDKQEYPKAIEACTEAIKLKGDNPDLYQIRGLAYYVTPDAKPKSALEAMTSFGSANKNAAIADFTKCTELAPTKPGCFYALGFVQLQTSSLTNPNHLVAAKNFSEAIRLKSKDEDVYFQRAEAYTKYYNSKDDDKKIRQRNELAVADYTKDIERRPTSYQGLMGRGLVYWYLEKNDLSVADFTKALQLLTASGEQNLEVRRDILGKRAMAYSNLGKEKEACEDLKAIGKECK
jgi:tetratricopeptide (TPR) repeat protein